MTGEAPKDLSPAFGQGRFTAALALLTVFVRGPGLVLPFFSGDEATYSALAVRILRGALPYAGAVDHKPIGIELTYALIYSICGPAALWAVRIVFAATTLLTALCLGTLMRRLLVGEPAGEALRAGRWAAVAYVVASSWGLASDVQAANTELFLNLPIVIAAILCVDALQERPRAFAGVLVRAIGAGMLIGLSGLYKYQAALVGGALAATAVLTQGRAARGRTTLLGLALGFVAVAGAYVGFFALSGHLDALLYWGWRFNFSYMGVLSRTTMLLNALKYTALIGALWSPLIIAIVASPPGRAFGQARVALPLTWLVAALLAVSAGGRFFPHYYLMALPPTVLLAGTGLAALWVTRGRQRSLLAALAIAATVFSLVTAWGWYRWKPRQQQNTDLYRAVGDYVRTHSAREERVFVWGNSPEIYFFAERAMGTRFPFCNYHTGLIWGSPFYDDNAPGSEAHIVPRAWTELLEDLRQTPPTYVVDAAAGGLDHFERHPIARYPQLAELVGARYDREATVAGVPIYRLRR